MQYIWHAEIIRDKSSARSNNVLFWLSNSTLKADIFICDECDCIVMDMDIIARNVHLKNELLARATPKTVEIKSAIYKHLWFRLY